jgi:hypothetical protein
MLTVTHLKLPTAAALARLHQRDREHHGDSASRLSQR